MMTFGGGGRGVIKNYVKKVKKKKFPLSNLHCYTVTIILSIHKRYLGFK